MARDALGAPSPLRRGEKTPDERCINAHVLREK